MKTQKEFENKIKGDMNTECDDAEKRNRLQGRVHIEETIGRTRYRFSEKGRRDTETDCKQGISREDRPGRNNERLKDTVRRDK